MKRFNSKTTGVLSPSDLKGFKGRVIYWAFFVLLVMVSLISLVLVIWTVLTSFKETKEIYSAFSFLPENMSIGHLAKRVSESWNALQLGSSFVNTIVMSLGTLFVHITVCGFGGYVLSKLKPKGTKIVFTPSCVDNDDAEHRCRMVPNYMSWLHFPVCDRINGVGVNLSRHLLADVARSRGPIHLPYCCLRMPLTDCPISYVEAAKTRRLFQLRRVL